MKMNDKASPIFDKWEKLYYEENDKLDLDATTIEEEEQAEEDEGLTDEELMAFYADKEEQRQKDNFAQSEVYG